MIGMRIIMLLFIAGCWGCGGSDPASSTSPDPDGPTPVAENQYITTSTGLKYFDFTVGTGEVVTDGNLVTVHYEGWLFNGPKIDSSIDRGAPFRFALGFGETIPGWNEGIAGMRVGGKRQLVIPPDLAYADLGSPPLVPPNTTLVFEVEVISVE